MASTNPVAPWIRALRWFDDGVQRAFQIHEAVRDEIFLAFTPPVERPRVTGLAYSENPVRYVPGGTHFDGGLFDWERAAIPLLGLGATSRLLIAGAGGGRELTGFAPLVGEVVAFEPSAPLCETAAQVGRRLGNVAVHLGSYQDFLDAANGRGGPLAGALGPYDAAVLGRNSLGHLTDSADRLAVLKALRKTSPAARVLATVTMRRGAEDIGQSPRVRRILRRAFGTLGGQRVDDGLRYVRTRGFLHQFTYDEIAELATRAGYSVVSRETWPLALRQDRPTGYFVLAP